MQLIKSLVIIAALGVLTESAMASIQPYVGGGYEWTTANHRRGNSNSSMFNKYFGGSTVYVGARWKDVSLEIGHESTGRKDKSATYTAISKDQKSVAAGAMTRSNFEGFHLDLNTYMPVLNDLEFIGSLGYGLIKHRNSADLALMVDRNIVFAEDLHVSNKHKHSFRIGAGLEQMVCNHIGFRCMVRYKLLNNHSKLRSASLSAEESVRYKNIVSVSAGVIFKF